MDIEQNHFKSEQNQVMNIKLITQGPAGIYERYVRQDTFPVFILQRQNANQPTPRPTNVYSIFLRGVRGNPITNYYITTYFEWHLDCTTIYQNGFQKLKSVDIFKCNVKKMLLEKSYYYSVDEYLGDKF